MNSNIQTKNGDALVATNVVYPNFLAICSYAIDLSSSTKSSVINVFFIIGSPQLDSYHFIGQSAVNQ